MDDMFQIHDKPQRKGQRGMWVVAGCLAGTLVVYHSWAADEEKPEEIASRKSIATTPVRVPGTISKVRERHPIRWPAIAYDDLILMNPFQPKKALDTAFQTPADQADVERELEQSRDAKRKKQAPARELPPRDWKVRLLFQSDRGAAAVLGDRVVYEGDTIEGYQVVEIDKEGVVLEPVTDASPASR